jgi:anti-anti-sigma regulatory factor
MIEKNGWWIQPLGERVDCFNQSSFKGDLEQKIESGNTKIALDLTQTRFLSFLAIKMLAKWADMLKERGGLLMLIGPSEKLKRQIGIYASLENMLVMKATELPLAEEDAPVSESPALDESPGF